MNPTAELAPQSNFEQVPKVVNSPLINWEEPYNKIIADNIDSLSDVISGTLLTVPAQETHFTYEQGRGIAHPAVKFNYEIDYQGSILSIKPKESDDNESLASEHTLTVMRVEPLKYNEILPIFMKGKHIIADISYPEASYLALSSLFASINRYNGPVKDRYQTAIA